MNRSPFFRSREALRGTALVILMLGITLGAAAVRADPAPATGSVLDEGPFEPSPVIAPPVIERAGVPGPLRPAWAAGTSGSRARSDRAALPALPARPGPARLDPGPEATITVCPSGCDHSSIQAAVQAAKLGDLIFVGAGTYRERLQIPTSLTLRGVDPSVTIIEAGTLEGPLVTVEPGIGVTLQGLTIRNGRAPSGAGIYNQGAMLIANCIVSGNHTTGDVEGWGGGIFNYGGVMTIDQTVISGNRAKLGAGILNSYGSMTVGRSRIEGNVATLYGGAIFNGADASLRVDTIDLGANEVDQASAEGRGGGIYTAGFTYISRSTLRGNRTAQVGGAIFQYQDVVVLASSTVSGNSADYGGAAVYTSGGSMLVTNGTIVNNTGAFGALFSNDTVTLRNSLVGDNPGGSCYGPVTSEGYNLDSGNKCGFRAPGDLVNVNPRITALADNGGPTLTHGLAPNSPAIDAGDPEGCTDPDGALLGTDQRGSLSPVDGNGDEVKRCDIGAFEYDPDAAGGATPTPTPSGAGPGTITVCPSGCDHTRVQAAIDAAQPGNTIAVRPGVFAENLVVGKRLTIVGAGALATEIDGQGRGPVLTVATGELTVKGLALLRGQGVINNATLTLDGVTVAYNASPVAGGIRNSGTLAVLNSTIVSNVSLEENGGGILSTSGAVTVRNSSVIGNTANGQEGNGFGGGIYANGTLTLIDSLVSSNESRYGGGVALGGGTLEMLRTTVSGNRGEFGAGVYVGRATAEIEAGAINGNQGDLGGGLYALGTVTLEGVRLAQNRALGAYGFGGGVLSNGGQITIDGGTISENESTNGGGIYSYKPEANLTVQNAEISRNRSSFGAGIFTREGVVSVVDTRLAANAAFFDGGGLYAQSGPVAVQRGAIAGNTAERAGGGLLVGEGATMLVNQGEISGSAVDGSGAGAFVLGTLSLMDTDVLDNQTSSYESRGGGILVEPTGRLSVLRGALARNTATEGGGIANRGNLELVNATLSENAGMRGAGLHNAGTAQLASVTFFTNTLQLRTPEPTAEPTETPEPEEPAPAASGIGAGASAAPRIDARASGAAAGRSDPQPARMLQLPPDAAGGAIFNASGSTVTLRNTVVGNSGSLPSCAGSIASAGYNLDAGRSCGFSGTGDRSGVDPGLELLADNGGQTLTNALAAGSPAIDMGDPGGCKAPDGSALANDQRGLRRSVDGNGDGTARCDIGAFELDPSYVPTPTATPGGPGPTATPTGPGPEVTIFLPVTKKSD